jgi:hypothetical protein
MNTNETRTDRLALELSSANVTYGEAARRFRAAQVEYDRTRTMTAEYMAAEDGFRLAARRVRRLRGY